MLAITLHDAVFDRREVFADASGNGNSVDSRRRKSGSKGRMWFFSMSRRMKSRRLRNFDDLRKLRAQRGDSLFTFAPHPFYVLGASIGSRLLDEIDCFDAIEMVPFLQGLVQSEPARRKSCDRSTGNVSIATSDAHRLACFRFALHEHPASRRADGGECFAGAAPRSDSPNESSFSIAEIVNAIYFYSSSNIRFETSPGLRPRACSKERWSRNAPLRSRS